MKSHRSFTRGPRVSSVIALAALGSAGIGCSSSNSAAPSPGVDAAANTNTNADASNTPPDADEADAGGPDSSTYVEKTLTLDLALKTTVVDAGAGPTGDAAASDGGGEAGASIGDAAASDGGGEAGASSITTLTVTARDGVTPVVTDLWLYTLDSQGNMTPLTDFTSSQPRKSPRLMLPATIKGAPSGLSPADDGRENGTMTCACGSRGTLDQGAFVSGVTGTVAITLATVPTSPVLVVAGVEDERYAGAAVINPDGSPGTVPAGVGDPETHTRVSFARDVAPILHTACIQCHTGDDPTSGAGAGVGPGFNANFYYVTGTADELVNANFSINEQTLACETANPDGGLALAECIQSITQAQFLVEPGAPAASDLLQRSRPDENAGTSALGLPWYGSKGSRYNKTYGDRRMPSTTLATTPDGGAWNDSPCYFDSAPAQFQVIFDWVAQGAQP